MNPKLGMVKKGERNSENMATEARYPKLATPNAHLLLALSFGVYEKSQRAKRRGAPFFQPFSEPW